MSASNMSWTKFLPGFAQKRLEGRVQLQRILSNIAWLSIDKLLRLGVGAVIGVWIARYLGVAQFGLLNYALAFIALFSPLGSLGVESILVRDLLAEDDRQRQISLGTAFAMRIAGSVVAGILACITISILRPQQCLTFFLVAIAGLGLIAQSFDVIDLWFQSQVRAKFPVYAKNTAFLGMSIVRAGMLIARAPLIAFAWATSAEFIMGAAGLVYVYHRKGESLRRWRVRYARMIAFLKDSWPLAFASFAVILYMRIGTVMIGTMLGDSEVGIYSVAVRLAEMWYFIPMSIASSVFPSVIKAKLEDASLYRLRLEMFYNLMSLISISVALVTSFFSTFAIRIVFGVEYQAAGPALAVYIWASVPVFLNIASTQYLVAENRAVMALYRTIAGAVVNILLSAFLIPRYGSVGAALATLIAYTIATFSLVFVADLRPQVTLMLRSLLVWRTVRRIWAWV